MMQVYLMVFAGVLVGVLAGWMAASVRSRPRATRQAAEMERLRAELAAAGSAQRQLSELRAQLSGLRHDVRGILSPALLVSDRLLTHDEPHVRRAGEVMVRTVERAAERLMEAKLDQGAATKSQP